MTRTRVVRAVGILLAAIVLLAAIGAAGLYWVRVQRSRADLVLHGRIITLDDSMPVAAALAARDGRIVAIGPHDRLVHDSPLYARLAALQFAGPVIGLDSQKLDSELPALSAGPSP